MGREGQNPLPPWLLASDQGSAARSRHCVAVANSPPAEPPPARDAATSTTPSPPQLSGGGYRATTLALGWVRALHSIGAMRRARYLASNSGGSWLNGAYSFTQVWGQAAGPPAPGVWLEERGAAGGLHGSRDGAASMLATPYRARRGAETHPSTITPARARRFRLRRFWVPTYRPPS